MTSFQKARNAPPDHITSKHARWLDEPAPVPHGAGAIDYLMEENRLLKELHGDKRLHFTNEQRKRLARKGRKLGLNGLRKVTTQVTPETILSWHRKLIALKYTAKRKMSLLRKSQQEVRRMAAPSEACSVG